MAKKESEKEDFFHYLRIVIAVLMIAFLALACIAAYRFGYQVFTDDPYTTARTDHVDYDLVITEGESVLSVGEDLEANGIISNAWVFWVQSKVYDCHVTPGIYDVSSRTSSKEILKDLESAYQKTQTEE